MVASFGDNQSFITMILDIQKKDNSISLQCSPKEYLNDDLFNAPFVKFKTEYDGIEVHFESSEIKQQGELVQPFLSIKAPDYLYWLQRRESYRIRSPFSKNSYCSIPIQQTEQAKKELLICRLYDLSLTGFSIIADTLELSQKLTINAEFNDCTLYLEGNNTVLISFVVRNVIALNPNKSTSDQRMGCELINSQEENKITIKQYMQSLKLEKLASFNDL
jgi:c-di-GMP-binding flagellar brake protein YcgR